MVTCFKEAQAKNFQKEILIDLILPESSSMVSLLLLLNQVYSYQYFINFYCHYGELIMNILVLQRFIEDFL